MNYQSYQSGIETYWTIEAANIVSVYQSYQSGIETLQREFNGDQISHLPIVPKWNWNSELEEMNEEQFICYQSYQSGIETEKTFEGWWKWIYPTNRTKVELKHTCDRIQTGNVGSYQSYQSGIETGKPDEDDRIAEKATNRTKVELKRGCARFHDFHRNRYQSYQSGIETCISLIEVFECGGLPIVPKWNWNPITVRDESGAIVYQSYQSGIET